MHYSATAVIEKHGPKTVREAIAKGAHLSTLAFSEVGSRSQFWAPVSSARRDGNDVVLDAEKSFVTSASRATAYVWSSRPLEGEGASTLWLVPRAANGLQVARPFDGLGLRGNDSAPVTARGTRVAESARLGDEGGGFGVMMGIVLPFFNVMNAATSVGLMQEATRLVAAHAGRTKFENQGSALCDLPTIRAQIAKMQVRTDMAFALWQDTLDAIEGGRPEAQLRVLESKAACNDAANEVLDVALRVTGGAGYRKDLPIERLFRDARAGSVMGPTADVLYEFIGRAVTGLPLF
jgi:alkylation response protein AidB-like acyl-CoA dehydrogenase